MKAKDIYKKENEENALKKVVPVEQEIVNFAKLPEESPRKSDVGATDFKKGDDGEGASEEKKLDPEAND
jgi:hypothetical protein